MRKDQRDPGKLQRPEQQSVISSTTTAMDETELHETTLPETTVGKTTLAEAHAAKCELAAEVLRSCGRLRLKVTGWSMLPTIWPGEMLMIQHTESDAVSEGDIVLCARERKFSAHRVIGKSSKDSSIVTQGDAMAQIDPPVSQHDLLGKVAFIVRNGKCIAPDKKLRLRECAVAALVRRSDLAARLVVGVHGMRRRSGVQNANDQAVRFQDRLSQDELSQDKHSQDGQVRAKFCQS